MAAQDACRGQHFLDSRCLMCPEYEYINLDVGSSGTGELSKALPKIERTARLVQESTGLLFRYIPNG